MQQQNQKSDRLLAATVPGVAVSQSKVYLNDQNITVSLGSGMASNPFANRPAVDSLASIIDATSASISEFHNQSTHAWVSGGPLELVLDYKKSARLAACIDPMRLLILH
ncbi:MAG: hypothetical protein L0H37_03210 [Nitrosospira sp.]|nr:hypothetical protein [Nitrosospira sp.]